LEEAKEKPKFVFEPLGSAHDRAAFSCEEPILENYLKTRARQEVSKKLAAVYIMTVDGKTIAGFYTLSQYSILSGEIPDEITRKLTKYDQIPATLIGRLARHTAHRGTGAGDLLLVDALQRCLAISRQAASWAVVVEAKNERGVDLYKKFGFEGFPSRPLKMFLPTATIEKMFG
jgi:ribosomal protein S18 acetylase RimI-like enzyme